MREADDVVPIILSGVFELHRARIIARTPLPRLFFLHQSCVSEAGV